MPTIIKDKANDIVYGTAFDANAVVSWLTLGIAVCLTIVSVSITVCHVVMFEVDQTQMSTLYTTTAQTVGGLYGLTLTAYVFFVDKFRESTKDDETLYDATNAVLLNLFAGLVSISILCGLIIVTSLVGVANLGKLADFEYWLINENVLLFILEIVAILFFGVQLLDPKKLDKELNRMKKVDSKKNGIAAVTRQRGNVVEFFERYNKLENDILFIANYYLPNGTLNEKASKPRIIRGLQIMNARQIVNGNVMILIDNLRKCRDILIHGSECSVTNERMDEVRKIGSLISEVRKLLEDKKEGTVEWEMTIKQLYDFGNQL